MPAAVAVPALLLERGSGPPSGSRARRRSRPRSRAMSTRPTRAPSGRRARLAEHAELAAEEPQADADAGRW